MPLLVAPSIKKSQWPLIYFYIPCFLFSALFSSVLEPLTFQNPVCSRIPHLLESYVCSKVVQQKKSLNVAQNKLSRYSGRAGHQMFRADIVSPEFTSVMQKKRNVLLYVLNYNVNRGDAFRCSASGTTCTFCVGVCVGSLVY